MNQQDPAFHEQELQEWNKIRQQCALPSEQIGQNKAVELIQQWIVTTSGPQFSEYESKTEEKQNKLNQVIRQVLAKRKQSNYLLVQKYDYDMAKDVRENVRKKYQCFFKEQEEAKKQNQQDVKEKELVEQQPGKNEFEMKQEEKLTVAEGPNLQHFQLPSLPPQKRRGKVYNPQQMAPYFQLNTESVQQYSPRHPHLFQTKRKLQISNKAKIFTNKYLKLTFQRFCKRAYNPKGLFGEYLLEADKMSLNKWMVFCKEFDFTDKFHSKHLLEIYQNATKFGSSMNLQQFLTAVGLLQQKYVEKYHKGENFVQDVLKINNQAAFKIKMDNLKVHYGGPTKNFFEYASYTEAYKREDRQKQKEFRAKKKEREIVLIKGMYEEHIRSEVQKRKQQRQFNKVSRSKLSALNRSSVVDSHHNRQVYSVPRSPPINKSQLPTYSKLFNTKKYITKKDTHSSLSRQAETPFQATNMPRGVTTTSIREKQTEYSTVKEGDKGVGDESRRQWTEGSNPSIWMTRLRSDSEQSDQILKQHLQHEKKMRSKLEESSPPQWMKEMAMQSQRVSEIEQQLQQDEATDVGPEGKLRKPWRTPY